MNIFPVNDVQELSETLIVRSIESWKCIAKILGDFLTTQLALPVSRLIFYIVDACIWPAIIYRSSQVAIGKRPVAG